MPTLLTVIDAQLDSVAWVEIHEGKVTAGYCVRNPEKLRAVKLPDIRP